MLAIQVLKRLREITLEVDLTCGSGVTALVGPSGSGKSTLLRLVAGLARPDQGLIRLGSTLLDDTTRGVHVEPWRRNIGLVFQDYALFPHLSVARNVSYGLEARRLPRSERRRQVDTILERLGIASLANERPGALSGGQRQRVALARALVTNPQALLLDEPLAALDVQTRTSVRRELRGVLADLAIPTLLVTHDYADALIFRERIIILVDGQVVQDGSHADLLAHPRSRFVADFTGVNYLEGVLQPVEVGKLGCVDLAPGLEIHVPANGIAPGPVGISLHPWEVTLSQSPPAGSARNVLPGAVREVLPLGGRVRVVLEIGPAHNHTLVAEITPEAQEALGCKEGQVLYGAFKATALSMSSR